MPIAFLTLTEKGQASLWVENLSYTADSLMRDTDLTPFKAIDFSCAHCFTNVLDISYVSLSIMTNSESYKESNIRDSSRILDPRSFDYISAEKVRAHKAFLDSMVCNQSKGISMDFFAVLAKDCKVEVFSVQSLRNYPQCSIDV